MEERGIVVSQQIEYTGEKLAMDGRVSPQLVRHQALYWDYFDCPIINGISSAPLENNPSLQRLDDLGVLRRSVVQVEDDKAYYLGEGVDVEEKGWELGEIVEQIYKTRVGQLLLPELKSKEGVEEYWSVSQEGVDIRFPEQLKVREPVADIELHNFLPSPKSSVPIEDIIEFRRNRSDELRALWSTLDELYLQVTQSGDPRRAGHFAKNELATRIQNLSRTLNEEGIETERSSIWVQLRDEVLPNVFSDAAGGLTIAETIDGSLLAGAALGAAVSSFLATFRLNVHESETINNVPSEHSDFAYLYHADQEGVADIDSNK